MKKISLLLICSLVAIGSLFANGAKEVVEEDLGKTSITFWAFPTFKQEAGSPAGSFERTIIEAFEASHPNIEVKLETIDFSSGPDKIISAIEGGTAPDILFDAPGRIVEYGKNGKLVSLNDIFTDELKNDINNEAIIGACSDGSNYWMYPLSSSPFWMSLNKDMWEKSGALEFVNLEGDRTWTTENWVKGLEKLTKAGYVSNSVYCGGQGGDQGTRALVTNLYSATIANEDKTEYSINSEEGIKGLTLLKKLYDEGKIDAGLGIAAGDEIELYSQSYLSSSICWGTSAASKWENTDFDKISVPFPSDDGVPSLEYLVNGFCIFDNEDSARAEAAKEFVKFICDDSTWGPKNVVQSAAFPVRQSYGNLYEGDNEYELLSNWTKYYGPYYNTMDGFNNMRVEWWNMLQFIFIGDKTVTQAANDFVKNSNANM